MSEYYCTNCGADLGDQPGFDPSNGYWTCTECGKLMLDPNDSDFDSDVAWFCDECGACLNKQYGFSDSYSSWTCTECGHTNPIGPDEIYESVAAYQAEKARRDSYFSYDSDNDDDDDEDDEDEDDEDDDDYDEDDSDDNGDYNYSYSYSTNSSYHSGGIIDSIKDFFSNVWKWIKRIFFCTIAICVLFTGWKIYDFFSAKETAKIDNSIIIGISPEEVIGKNYESIEKELEEKGFTHVSSYKMYDLNYSERSKEGTIGTVSVDDNDTFASSEKYEKNVSIVIEYHSLKYENPPMTSKEAKKQNYNDVVKAFENLGFGNIKLVQEKDLIKGWIVKDGSVESVAIDGDTKYKTTSSFLVDKEITITYHTFKDK